MTRWNASLPLFKEAFPPRRIGPGVAVEGAADGFVEGLALQATCFGGLPGGLDGFGVGEFLDAAGAHFWALFFCAATAVEAVDEVPIEVAAGVEADVARLNRIATVTQVHRYLEVGTIQLEKSSPSPRPSPPGRGRIVGRLLAMVTVW